MRLKSAILILASASMASTGFAGTRTSAKYSVAADNVDSGGGRTISVNYWDDGSLGDIGGTANVGVPPATLTLKDGFMGQLYEAQTLAIAADPASVNEGRTTQLSSVATLDDGSLIKLGNSEALWSILDGPLISITSGGLATAGEVFINAPATVRGAWAGIQGELTLSVLNVSVMPPGDSVPDPFFTSGAFATSQAGLYQGLLKDSGGNFVGTITGFNLLATRAFSAKVVFNGITYSLAGSLLADGSFSGQILRTGKTALVVNLQLGHTPASGPTLQGSVAGDGATGSGFIAQAPHNKQHQAPAEWVKSYTFLLPATAVGNAALPEGDGYGSAKVSALGVITAAGKTGDGVAFTTSGYLTGDHQWHLFQSLYSSKGQIAGVLTFREVPGISDVDGPVRWAKNPNAANKSYPAGFALAPELVGAFYTPPLAGQRALSELANQPYNARLTLGGTILPGSRVAKTLSWLPTNTVAYYGPETLTGTMTSATGVLTGTYTDPVSKLTVPFAGAVLQKQGLAGGNFLVSNRAGFLFIQPGTGFPYPGSEGAGASLAGLDQPPGPAAAPLLTPANFSAAAAGSFGGILTHSLGISGGLDSVVLSSTGVLSGTVVIEGKRYAFKGTLGADGLATVVIARTGLPNIVGTIQLALANGTVDGFQLTGAFTVDGVTHAIDAQRFPTYTAALPSPLTGKYTLSMPAPEGANITVEPGGDGYASLVIANTGAITGTWVLADSTTATFGGRASRNKEWSLVRSLYGATGGYLAGKVTFRDVAGISDLDGQMRWVKPSAVPRTLTYTGGFDVTRGVVGSLYMPPAPNQRAFATLDDVPDNAWLRLSGPDLSTLPALVLNSVDRALTWNAANKIFYYGPDKATLTFAPATGLLTGSYIDTPTGVDLTFGVVLLQKQGRLTGRFSTGGQTGLMAIEPR